MRPHECIGVINVDQPAETRSGQGRHLPVVNPLHAASRTSPLQHAGTGPKATQDAGMPRTPPRPSRQPVAKAAPGNSSFRRNPPFRGGHPRTQRLLVRCDLQGQIGRNLANPAPRARFARMIRRRTLRNFRACLRLDDRDLVSGHPVVGGS